MSTQVDIAAYHDALDEQARPICDRLFELIERELGDAQSKVWHGHPVWFFDGNPIVGYDRLKQSVRLLFWSGQSFETPGLSSEGSFKAAEVRYTASEQIDEDAVKRWLSEARQIQWNYRDIRQHRGAMVPLRGLPSTEG